MTRLQRLCPHIFGWSYNTHRRRRFCRICAWAQRLDRDTGQWVNGYFPQMSESEYRDYKAKL